MPLHYIKLLAYINHIELRQDTSNCLLASISFHNCAESAVELSEDGSWDESCSELVEGLLCISLNEENAFSHINQTTCLGTMVDNKLTIVVL